MKERINYQKSAIEDIKRRVTTLNLTFVLITFLILLLTVRFMYKFLNYIPFYSAITMLAIMAVLIFAGFLLINVITRNAIKIIDAYSSKLNTLLATSKDIQEIVHSDILLEKIMEVSQKITGADGGSLALLEGDKFVFKVLKGEKIGSLPEITISNCVGILGCVLGNSKVIRVDDTKQDLRFYPEIDEVTGCKAKSVLCAPLKLRSGVIGAVELVSKNNGAFTKEDEEIISYFADQAALSIENAKSHENEKNFQIHLTNILSNINDKIAGKRGHSKRIAKYALLMAQTINMSEDEQARLYRASLLHDLGFLNTRAEDLISINDYRSHSQLGYEILKPINFYSSGWILTIYIYNYGF